MFPQVIETDQHHCYVMPLGKTDLAQYMDRLPVGAVEESAVKYGGQLLAAVAHVHKCGIIHNDIKLENCIVDGSDTLKLTDFGLSRYAVDKVHILRLGCCGFAVSQYFVHNACVPSTPP